MGWEHAELEVIPTSKKELSRVMEKEKLQTLVCTATVQGTSNTSTVITRVDSVEVGLWWKSVACYVLTQCLKALIWEREVPVKTGLTATLRRPQQKLWLTAFLPYSLLATTREPEKKHPWLAPLGTLKQRECEKTRITQWNQKWN